MKKKVLLLSIILLLMYVSFTVGLRIGGTKAFNGFFNEHVNDSATDVELKVKTLEMLKKGDTEKAEEFIELLLDNNLGFLGVTAENKGLKDKAKVLEAIKTAKRYREKYPGHKAHPNLNTGVLKAFGLVEK
jgi:pyoverdine/dityrosine biosynthesis protein Dit1